MPYAIEDLIKEALREGVYALLKKPIDFDLLLKTIETAKNDGALVMVVDDDVAVRETMRDILIRNGYRVMVADDGPSAINQVKIANFDIIILDMKLPVLNGLETYLGIRELRPDAVVILITGYPLEMGDLATRAIENGAYIYLQKPFSVDRLLEILKEIVKNDP